MGDLRAVPGEAPSDCGRSIHHMELWASQMFLWMTPCPTCVGSSSCCISSSQGLGADPRGLRTGVGSAVVSRSVPEKCVSSFRAGCPHFFVPLAMLTEGC